MYTIETTALFKKSFAKLSKKVQNKCMSLITLLAIDYRDARLRTKKLKGGRIEYSFRVTRDYRCTFYFEPDNTIVLSNIDHRKDIYR
jgi:mRNA-degrading endonuclease RelE of RelBE toxin-antitoxin system